MNALRHALSDDHFAVIELLLPTNDRPGHPWKAHRRVIDGIFWILHTGAPRATCPVRPTAPGRPSTSGSTAGVKTAPGADSWRHSRSGSTTRGHDRLGAVLHRRQFGPGVAGRRRGVADGRDEPRSRRTTPWAARAADSGSKIHLVCDGSGLPMAVTVTAGQRHESTQFEAVMGQIRVPRPKGRPRCRPAEARRGQGLQLSADPASPAATRDQGRHPDPQGPKANSDVREGDLPPPQRGRALHRLAEGEPPAGDPVREAGGEFLGHGQARHARTIAEGTIARQGLEVVLTIRPGGS